LISSTEIAAETAASSISSITLLATTLAETSALSVAVFKVLPALEKVSSVLVFGSALLTWFFSQLKPS